MNTMNTSVGNRKGTHGTSLSSDETGTGNAAAPYEMRNRLSLSWTSSRTGTKRPNSSTPDIKFNLGSPNRQVQLIIEPDGAISVNE